MAQHIHQLRNCEEGKESSSLLSPIIMISILPGIISFKESNFSHKEFTCPITILLCVCVWVRECVSAWVRECVSAWVRECVSAWVRVRECARARVCASVRARVCVCVRACVRACVRHPYIFKNVGNISMFLLPQCSRKYLNYSFVSDSHWVIKWQSIISLSNQRIGPR